MIKKPSTQEIINAVALVVQNKFDIEYIDFESWYAYIISVQSSIISDLNDDIKEFFPLRKEVWKLVVKKIYGVMPFSKEYILKHYRNVEKDIPYLLYPSKNPKKLIVLFTGYIDYESYNRFSWFFDEKEQWESDTVYLFLGDQDLTWYVGEQDNSKVFIYKKIIDNIIEMYSFPREKVYMVGASMGGYAAILFGVLCSIGGIISVHPQLTAKSANRYHLNNWKRQINKCGINFIDLDDLIAQYEYIPPIYLEVGKHPADEFGIHEVISELNKKNCLFIIMRHDSKKHETHNPSREQLEALIDFFDQKKIL